MHENSSDEDLIRVNGEVEPQDANHLVSKGNAGFLFKVSESTDKLSSLENDGTLPLKAGDIVVLLSTRGRDDGWWYGEKIGESSKKGFFRSSSVMRLVASDPDVSSFEVLHDELEFDRTNDFLGRGGFAQVYSGSLRGTKVAIKVPTSQSMQNDKNLIKKLKKEAYIQHSLEHENIVKLMKISIDNPVERCLVLEFCAGGPLTPIIYHRAISPKILLKWALQIARGMRYLHCFAPIPIIHKDLKSNNILIAQSISPDDDFENKTMKITDFGLAKPIEFENQPQTSAQGGGTFAWMAPEVIKRSLYTHASDAWSFGIVFWEMLLGLAPFEGIPYHTVLYKIGEHNLTLPIPTLLDNSFTALLRGCWDISVGTRRTFGQIENELCAVIQKFEEWPDLSGEAFVMNRREKWYPDINYDYITNVGGQEMVTLHLVEQLLRERKEKRDAQLRLAENELREALNANSVHRKSKGKSHRRKTKELNCESISFPQGDVKHIIGVTDEEQSRSVSGSVDMLFHESAKSPLTPVKSPQIGRFGGTWDHRRKQNWGRPILERSHFEYDHSYTRGVGVETGSLTNRDLGRSKSCKDSKFSQSESNILNIGAAMESSVNQSSESANDREVEMSVSDSIDAKESLTSRIRKQFSNLYKKRNKEKKNCASPSVGTPLRIPQKSFIRMESQRGPKVVDRGVSHPEKLITISSGAQQRPTNLEISSPFSKSFLSQGSTSGHYMSSYSGDEFESSYNASRIFSPSRQIPPSSTHFSPGPDAQHNGGFGRIDEARNSPHAISYYCNSVHSNNTAATAIKHCSSNHASNLSEMFSPNTIASHDTQNCRSSEMGLEPNGSRFYVCSPGAVASHMFMSPSFTRKRESRYNVFETSNGGNRSTTTGLQSSLDHIALTSPVAGDVDNNNSYILDSPSCIRDLSPALPPRQHIVCNGSNQSLKEFNNINMNNMIVTRREHYTSHVTSIRDNNNMQLQQQQLSFSSSSSMSGSNPDCNSLPRRTETLTPSDVNSNSQSQTLVFSTEIEIDEATDSPISFPTCPPPPIPPRPRRDHHPNSCEISPSSCGFMEVYEGNPQKAIVTAPSIVTAEESSYF